MSTQNKHHNQQIGKLARSPLRLRSGTTQTPLRLTLRDHLKKGGYESPPFGKGGLGGDPHATTFDHTRSQSSQSGFTLMESLMAMVVVSILMVSIAPMIVLSVATRVQARRIELGTLAAWSYVDALRSQTTEAPDHGVYLDLSDSDKAAEKRAKFINEVFSKVEAPDPTTTTALDNCTPSAATDYPYCEKTKTSSLYCVDNDEEPGCSSDSLTDMVIQSFRSTTDAGFSGLTDSELQEDAEKGYLLSARVYRADAFSGSEKLKSVGTDGEEGKQNTFTSGLGFRNVPLLEVTTEIPAVGGTGYSSLCERLGGCD